MKHSIGRKFLAGSGQEIFTVPNGYIAIVYMAFITNTSGSTNSYDMSWVHAHDASHIINFAYGKSLGSGSSDQFTNGELVMKSGDKMTITNSGTMDVIITFDLIQAMPLYAFANE